MTVLSAVVINVASITQAASPVTLVGSTTTIVVLTGEKCGSLILVSVTTVKESPLLTVAVDVAAENVPWISSGIEQDVVAKSVIDCRKSISVNATAQVTASVCPLRSVIEIICSAAGKLGSAVLVTMITSLDG